MDNPRVHTPSIDYFTGLYAVYTCFTLGKSVLVAKKAQGTKLETKESMAS